MKGLLLVAMLLQAPAVASKISGYVTTLPSTSLPTTLTLRIYGGNNLNLKQVAVSADGSFEVSGLAPGEFSLSLGAPFVSPSRNFTFRSGDVTNFEIKVPTEIPGRVVVADGSAVASPISLVVTTPVTATNIGKAAPKIMTSRASPRTGDFVLPAYPGENSIRVESVPAGYAVKSITYGALDVMNNPLRLDSAPASTLIVTLSRS